MMNDASLLRAEILEDGVWVLLRAVVSRRVPAADVDDVVQATLCDALDARRVPEKREDMRRWLVGIAKNKATDHFRRSCREVAVDMDALSVPVPPFDSALLLKRAIAEAKQDPAQRRTLELAVREADGESYAELARTDASSEVALRQRVSRFRRGMAARWQVAAAVLGAMFLVYQACRMTRYEPAAILPDADPAMRIALHPVEGHWEVEDWSGSEAMPPHMHVEIRGGALRVVSPAGERVFVVSEVAKLADGTERWHMSSPSAGKVLALVERDANRATVTLNEGRWAGTATLVRR